MKVYPSILTKNFKELEDKINLVRDLVKIIHLDIMDGIFVKNKTIYDIEKINSFDWKINYELHLMVEEKEIEKWINTFAKRVIFHYESVSASLNGARKCQEIINKIKEKNKEAGIAINIETDVENIFPYLNDLNLILIMSVNPGHSGQKFNPNILKKVKKLRDKEFKGIIEVDGGVNKENIQEISNSGASAVSVASAIWNDKTNIKSKILELSNF